MPEQQAAHRFGRDTLTRIAGTTQFVTLAAEFLPGEPMYSPVPFLPSIVSGGGTVSGGSGSTTVNMAGTDIQVWNNYPARVDLVWYQGDDVLVPLYFDNPDDTDMSDQDGFAWFAQVRLCHTYRSTLVYSFTVESSFMPADPDQGQDMDLTKVVMFLPRQENIYIGQYRWDLYSLSPIDLSEFGPPAEWDPDDPWPPTDRLRTWLYGNATVLPRVTSTDFLPPPDTGDVLPPLPPDGSGGNLFFVGPNGRVP